MASDELIESHREKAEVYHGKDLCKKKSVEIFGKYSLPKGLLSPIEITELGHEKSSGFFWCKTKEPKQHKFKLLGKTVSFDTTITMFAEKGRVRDIQGLQGKEYFVWLPLFEVKVEDPDAGNIMCIGPKGLSRVLPFAAFELEEEKNGNPKDDIAK